MESTLARWIESNNVTRAEFAEMAGLSKIYVNEVCRLRKWPRQQVFLRILKVTRGEVTPTDHLLDMQRAGLV